MPEKDKQFPSGLQAFLLVLALFMVEYVIGAALYDARGWLGLSGNQLDAMVSVLANGCVFSVVMHYQRMTYGALFHASKSSPALTLLLLLPPIVMLLPALVLGVSALVDFVTQLAPLSSSEEAMFRHMGAGNLAAVLVTCVLAPVLEEMLFRGVVLRGFLSHYPRWAAIGGSAVLFGFAHLNVYQFFAGFVIGLLAGWLYERTRSLIPCIVLHVSYNTALTGLSLSARDGSLDVLDTSAAFVWVLALLLAACSAALLRRMLLPQATRA